MSGEDDKQGPLKLPPRLRALGRNAVITLVAIATAIDNAQNLLTGVHQVAHIVSGHLGF